MIESGENSQENYLVKAKSKETNEWIIGYLVQGVRSYIISLDATEYMVVSLSGMASVEFIEIDPDTICKSTGKKDKDGNIVFVGDVIVDKLDDCVGVVAFDPTRGFYVNWVSGESRECLTCELEYWVNQPEYVDLLLDFPSLFPFSSFSSRK